MHIPLHAILQLTTRHALFAIATFGLASHCIFRRREPVNAIVLVALLVLLPAIFSLLLAPHYSVAKAIALSFITYFSTLFTSILAYRVSPFHPLAQYPGPLICKVSAFWMAWVAKTGKRHVYMQRLHDQYGDVVRTGIPFIVDP
ncbi:hypothetical protein PHLCEN_2v13301 [Hermanssonia centrifuga]|uniref:Uncharacterized protein n=1 Tax=Hermanssonia centrifuga TaxID=98765 RepID=A0A2R6NEP4_9APHY|nr:hypothetical protein PHLCEN_2v13301 [Hermanssonia centrifuga]